MPKQQSDEKEEASNCRHFSRILNDILVQWGKLRKAFADGTGYASGKQTVNSLHKMPMLTSKSYV